MNTIYECLPVGVNLFIVPLQFDAPAGAKVARRS
jgi:hypothetical protein